MRKEETEIHLIPETRATRQDEQVEKQLHKGIAQFRYRCVLSPVKLFGRDLGEGRVELCSLRGTQPRRAIVDYHEQLAQPVLNFRE